MSKTAKKSAPKKTKAKIPAKKAKPQAKAKAKPVAKPLAKPAAKKVAPAPAPKAKAAPAAKPGFPSVSTPAARAAVVASGGTGKLGTKRTCRKCYAKFYDFEKNPIVCPKCQSEFSPEDFETKLILKAEPVKKPKPAEVDSDEEGGSGNEDIVVISTNEDFESVEDLGEEENVIGNLSVDGDENDDEY